jgi:hypothetical protein
LALLSISVACGRQDGKNLSKKTKKKLRAKNIKPDFLCVVFGTKSVHQRDPSSLPAAVQIVSQGNMMRAITRRKKPAAAAGGADVATLVGKLSRPEIDRLLIQKIADGKKVTIADVKAIVEPVEAEEPKVLHSKEYHRLSASRKNILEDDFKQFDVNGDGEVSLDEVCNAKALLAHPSCGRVF